MAQKTLIVMRRKLVCILYLPSRVILNSHASTLFYLAFYADDCLTGANNLEEATHVGKVLNHLLDKAQMTIRKWRSNYAELKTKIPEGLLEKDEVQLISALSACHKALGVHWNTANDSLHVAIPTLEDIDLPTKCQVLSDIAKMFYVLGWFSPVTVTLKILLQKIWHLGIEGTSPFHRI